MNKEPLVRHLILLRHGETDANAQSIVQGQSHVPLNATGHEQARRLAQRLTRYEPKIELLISSDLRRAMETAERIGHAVEIDVVPDAGWRERGLGVMEGRPFADLLTWRAQNGEDTPPGGETREQMAGRVRETIQRTMETHAQRGVIAVVSHGGTIQLVLKMLVDGHLPLASGHAPVELCDVVNCSILHLAVSHGRWTVHCVNDASHLADLPARGRPNPDASTHSRSSQV